MNMLRWMCILVVTCKDKTRNKHAGWTLRVAHDVNKIKEILLKRYRHLIRKERLGKKVLGCDIEERTTKNKMNMPVRQEKYMTLSR